jgi:transcriptional regulator with XRE-family HTH domain
MADRLQMTQSNYSKIERNEIGSAEKLKIIQNLLEFTPNEHFLNFS